MQIESAIHVDHWWNPRLGKQAEYQNINCRPSEDSLSGCKTPVMQGSNESISYRENDENPSKVCAQTSGDMLFASCPQIRGLEIIISTTIKNLKIQVRLLWKWLTERRNVHRQDKNQLILDIHVYSFQRYSCLCLE